MQISTSLLFQGHIRADVFIFITHLILGKAIITRNMFVITNMTYQMTAGVQKEDKVKSPSNAFEPRHEKTCFCHMRITKAHISSLITTFVIRCLDSIIVYISKISRL